MTTLPVVSQSTHNQTPITDFAPEPTPAPKPSSCLASILAQSFDDDEFEEVPPIAPRFEEPLYTAEQLHRLHTSRVAQPFHIVKEGRLKRRGICVGETPTHYKVIFIDVFGLPADTRRVAKSATHRWQWFGDVEESNAEYARMFGRVN